MTDALALIAEMRGMIARGKDGGRDGVAHLREQLAAQTDVIAALIEMSVDAEDRARMAEAHLEMLEADARAGKRAKAKVFELNTRIAQLEGECERLRTDRDRYKEMYELGQFDRELLAYLREHERYSVERAVTSLSRQSSGQADGRMRLSEML